MARRPYFTRIFFFTLFLLCLSFSVMGQKGNGDGPSEEEIHLESGWIIRGEIIDENADYIWVETRADNVFVFPKNKVVERKAIKGKKEAKAADRKFSNFYHLSEWGIAASRTTKSDDNNISPSVYNSTGAYLSPNFQIGLGYGIDWYHDVIIAPIALDLRADIAASSVFSPYAFVSIGYGVSISNRSTFLGNDPTLVWNSKGGMRYNTGLGLKMRSSKGTDWILGFGYYFQRNKQVQEYWTGGLLEKTTKYRRLSIRTGFTF